MPAEAGIQAGRASEKNLVIQTDLFFEIPWIPAFAGMTFLVRISARAVTMPEDLFLMHFSLRYDIYNFVEDVNKKMIKL
jgi:hypothetical protein